MSGHADTIRDALSNRWDDGSFKEAFTALDALVAESEEDGRDLMSMQQRVSDLLAENQRLRDALERTIHEGSKNARVIARAALGGTP